MFRLQDILEAIEKIERYVKDMSISEFKLDELVIDAVVRNFEIMGEASKNVPPIYPPVLSIYSLVSDERYARCIDP